jgi:hypothetical protein
MGIDIEWVIVAVSAVAALVVIWGIIRELPEDHDDEDNGEDLL